MSKELPKLRLCIICGKLFEPQTETQYTHRECDEKEKEHEIRRKSEKMGRLETKSVSDF